MDSNSLPVVLPTPWVGCCGSNVLPVMLAVVLAACGGRSDSDPREQQSSAIIEHVTVAADPTRFKGWPASGGLWSWGDEILVAYQDCVLDTITDGHARKPPCFREHARSTDGGRTWTVEVPGTRDGRDLSSEGLRPPPTELDMPMDFTNPDFAFATLFSDSGDSFVYSYDRGRHWLGPYAIPSFGFECDIPNPDYIIDSQRTMMWFFYYCDGPPYSLDTLEGVLTHERPFLVRTDDGGLTWEFVSNTVDVVTAPNPPGVYYSEEPSSARLSPTTLVSLSRWMRDDGTEPWPSWMETWTSNDDGRSWTFTSRISDGPGTRPNVVLRPDGALLLTYEHRAPPYGIRARLSVDGGARWSDPLILRSEAGNWDIGYTVSAVRSDSLVVTVYYYNFAEHGPRTIEATIWDPYAAFEP